MIYGQLLKTEDRLILLVGPLDRKTPGYGPCNLNLDYSLVALQFDRTAKNRDLLFSTPEEATEVGDYIKNWLSEWDAHQLPGILTEGDLPPNCNLL